MDRRTLSAFLEVVCPSKLLGEEGSLDEVWSAVVLPLGAYINPGMTGWHLQHGKLERLRNDDGLPVEVANGCNQRTDANEQAS